jgi:hypothetical protein
MELKLSDSHFPAFIDETIEGQKAIFNLQSIAIRLQPLFGFSMRKLGTSLLIVLLLSSLVTGTGKAEVKNKERLPKTSLTKLDRRIVDAHRQLHSMSCIPMAIEMVLKLLGRAPLSYYDLQEAWKEKADGSFSNFNGRTIKGVTFHQQFGLPRNDQFPLARLFATIDRELKAGRYVIISLVASSGGWHMFVIYDEDADGDFVAVSKTGTRTIEAKHIKSVIKKMKGTDILTYKVSS